MFRGAETGDSEDSLFFLTTSSMEVSPKSTEGVVGILKIRKIFYMINNGHISINQRISLRDISINNSMLLRIMCINLGRG